MPISTIPFPDLDPVLVTIGPFAIRWYALAYIFGILLGWVYARAMIRDERNWGGPAPLRVEDFDDFILWVTLGIILGGRTGYVLFYNLPHFIEHPLEIFQVWNGGMSFHGGFLGCVVAVIGFATIRKLPVLSLGDMFADVPWAMIFPRAGPIPRHPSQLYEAGLEGLVLLAVLGLMVRAGALRRPGLILGAFAALYAVMRSFCEFFREPDQQLGFLWGGMTMGMLLSVPLFIAGVLLIAFALRRQPAYP